MAQALLASWVVETSSGLPLITLRLRQGVFSPSFGKRREINHRRDEAKKAQSKSSPNGFLMNTVFMLLTYAHASLHIQQTTCVPFRASGDGHLLRSRCAANEELLLGLTTCNNVLAPSLI